MDLLTLNDQQNIPPTKTTAQAQNASPQRGPSKQNDLKNGTQLSFAPKPLPKELSKTEVKESVKAFQAFSKGGHIEADEKARQAALELEQEQARVLNDPEALEKLRIADEEMAAALFAEDTGDSPGIGIGPSKDPELIRSSADGKRHEWQTTFIYGGSDHKHEMSLLDMD